MIDSTAPNPEPDAPVVAPEPEAPAAPVDDETAFEQSLDAAAIDVPDGEKLVPLSAVKEARAKLKDAKEAGRASAAELQQLRDQLTQANQQAAALAPMAEAFRALSVAQPQAQQQAPSAPTEDTGELEEVARDFDFYKTDGSLDLDRSRRHVARVAKAAQAIAQQQTAPLVQDRLTSAAQENLRLALATKDPATGQPLDPQVVTGMFQRLAQTPEGLRTLADREQVKLLWTFARGGSMPMAASPAAQQAAAAVTQAQPAPVLTERAGGAAVSRQANLSAQEKRAAKEAGISEKDYLEIAKGMPW